MRKMTLEERMKAVCEMIEWYNERVEEETKKGEDTTYSIDILEKYIAERDIMENYPNDFDLFMLYGTDYVENKHNIYKEEDNSIVIYKVKSLKYAFDWKIIDEKYFTNKKKAMNYICEMMETITENRDCTNKHWTKEVNDTNICYSLEGGCFSSAYGRIRLEPIEVK